MTVFDSISVRRQTEIGTAIDFGQLAELLVFYGHVTLIADPQMFISFLRISGFDVVQELLERGCLSITYLENHIGVRTLNKDTQQEVHDFVQVESPSQSLQTTLPKIMEELTGKRGRGRRLAQRLLPKITVYRYPQIVLEETLAETSNHDYVREAASLTIRSLVPEYEMPQPFVFDVLADGTGTFKIRSNIDFALLNSYYHSRVPPEHSSVDSASLLYRLLSVRSDIRFASEASSELCVSPLNAAVAGVRFKELLSEVMNSRQQLDLFTEFVFDDSASICEAVNSRRRNMRDVLTLLDAATPFKKWVSGKPADGNLLKEYLKEVGRRDWAEKLPPKTVRWGLFTAGGAVLDALSHAHPGFTAAGVALSAFDTFLLDRLIKGWKPNHFIEGPLKEFTERD